jgi:hypothetical protein
MFTLKWGHRTKFLIGAFENALLTDLRKCDEVVVKPNSANRIGSYVGLGLRRKYRRKCNFYNLSLSHLN